MCSRVYLIEKRLIASIFFCSAWIAYLKQTGKHLPFHNAKKFDFIKFLNFFIQFYYRIIWWFMFLLAKIAKSRIVHSSQFIKTCVFYRLVLNISAFLVCNPIGWPIEFIFEFCKKKNREKPTIIVKNPNSMGFNLLFSTIWITINLIYNNGNRKQKRSTYAHSSICLILADFICVI